MFGNVRNNAGVMFCPFQLTEDGIESQFATNHIGKISFNVSFYIEIHNILTKIFNPLICASVFVTMQNNNIINTWDYCLVNINIIVLVHELERNILKSIK